ncbi:MAG: hypothetical protein WD772_09740 [Pseudohongiellaceae bacterium]
MKSGFATKLLVILSLGMFSQFAMADNASATKTIAGILMNLNHFPSDADKAALMAIQNEEGTGPAFKAVAMAVHNMQHAATAEDKERLSQVVASDMAAAEAKTLAQIVLGMNHMASAEAKAQLQTLAM